MADQDTEQIKRPRCHIAPDRNDIEKNKLEEPEGERLRAELETWLEKNKIVGIMMDTPNHEIRIDWANRLPSEIKPILTHWGSIFIINEQENEMESMTLKDLTT